MAELNREIKRFRFRRRLDIDRREKHLCAAALIPEHTQAKVHPRVLQGLGAEPRPRERPGHLRPERNNEEKKRKGRKGRGGEASEREKKRRQEDEEEASSGRGKRPGHLGVPRGGVLAVVLHFRGQRPLNGRIKNSNGERGQGEGERRGPVYPGRFLT